MREPAQGDYVHYIPLGGDGECMLAVVSSSDGTPGHPVLLPVVSRGYLPAPGEMRDARCRPFDEAMAGTWHFPDPPDPVTGRLQDGETIEGWFQRLVEDGLVKHWADR